MQNLQNNVTMSSSVEDLSTPVRPKIADELLQKTTEFDPYKKELPEQKERWDMKKPSKPLLIITLVIAAAAGLITGYLAKRQFTTSSVAGVESPATQRVAGNNVKAGDVFGSNSEIFKDMAEGLLQSGGVDGEGSHKLLRPGGDSQTVYLTSSVTDLDKLVGMQVKVWGETYQGQLAGWLMDVGKIEVIDPAPVVSVSPNPETE